MFGSKKTEELHGLFASMIKRIDRLDNNGNAIRDRIRDLETQNDVLRVRIEQLEKKQEQLRGGLKGLVYDEPFTLPIEFVSTAVDVPIVDHVHVNNDLAGCHPEECIYCHRELNTHNND